ncbi:multimerin-2-like isoform X2 [Corythoichthys intestinalis]|uniref:multimerin-2-like isoform X2 n=1 Tax=Corythoichthys intestinalis TaxID=161448 RepID=UPI0025A5E454|nr:multimerin-2-like isoform X2 [Corythoichthys intestinalis]
MATVRILFLILAFPLSACGDVRARDPEVEQEEDEDWGDATGVVGATEETPLMQDGGNYPARSGNWCAFVQKRMVSMAVACGTEKYTIKSQSPCPSGTPDCHLVMYKLSTRPLYKQKQKVITALLWRCCPGHGGDNCDDTGILPHQLNPNREQNDHQGAVNTSHNVSKATYPVHLPNQDHVHRQEHNHHPEHVLNQDHFQHPIHVPNLNHVQYPVHVPNRDHTQHSGHVPNQDHVQYPVYRPNWDPTQHTGHVPNQDHIQYPVLVQERDTAQNPIPVHKQDHVPPRKHEHQEHLRLGLPASHPDAALALPHTVALLMSQLQPTLQHFNRSLERLEQRMDELARDAARLEDARRRREEDEAERRKRVDAEVERGAQQVAELRRELESRLHSQRAMLHFNISNFKTDLDLKIKRHNKMLQASLQAMNATLAEIKLDQEMEQEQQQDQEVEADPVMPQSSASSTAIWEAIERLDRMVINNTVKVDNLAEELAVTSDGLEGLRRANQGLGERIKQVARDGQVRFMETGLEVEAAKVAVLDRVEQLAGNLSRQGQRLHEMDVDVDYLYNTLYKNASSSCDCQHLDEALAQLERGVANVTELANEQSLILEEARRAASKREAAMEAVRVSLEQLEEQITSKEERTGTLEEAVRLLSVQLQDKRVSDGAPPSAGEPSEEVKRVQMEMKRLSASFNSLLKDAIRHSDVLEILLGEEVLEFLEWPVHDQEAHSIPAIREDIRSLRQSLQQGTGEAEEALSADEPSSRWPDDTAKNREFAGQGGARTSGESPRPPGGDGGDLWKLEKSVEELKLKMKDDDDEAAMLRTEVARLKRGLEEHLRTFKIIFSNADVLERSHAPLELDKLYQMMSDKEKKKRGSARNGRRNRRDT